MGRTRTCDVRTAVNTITADSRVLVTSKSGAKGVSLALGRNRITRRKEFLEKNLKLGERGLTVSISGEAYQRPRTNSSMTSLALGDTQSLDAFQAVLSG